VGICGFGGSNHLLVGSARFSVSDVIHDRCREQNWFLTHETHLVSQPLDIEIADVYPIKKHMSGLRVVKALQKADYSGLSTSTLSNEGECLTRLYPNGVVLEDRDIGASRICESDSPQLEISFAAGRF